MQAPTVKKSGVDAAKISAAKKRKKATTLVVAKKGKKPAPKVVAPSTKSESKEKELASNVIKSSSNHNSGAVAEDGGNSSSDEDYSDDEEEGEDGYRVGGYHPVSIGDKYNSRYIVIEKLGWGHFSTVWRCYDLKTSTAEKPEYVALKIQKSATHYREAAIDEIELLSCAKAATLSKAVLAEYPPPFDPCVVFLHDHFEHLGRNGNHVCMTFEILGENLLKVIKKYNYRGMPLAIVRDYVRQICQGMDFLHRHCKIIHTDLKPENILIAARSGEPDINFVRSIIADKVSGSGGASSKKKKKGNKIESTEGSAGKSAAASGNATELGPDGEPLSAEMKKKLKKKLKKKRQLARKNEDKKKGGARSSRRKVRGAREGNDKRAIENSVEKVTADLEMLMMERASIPLAEQAAAAARAGEEGLDLEGNDGQETASASPVAALSTVAEGKPVPIRAFAQSKSGSKELSEDKDSTYRAAKHQNDDDEEEEKGDDEKHGPAHRHHHHNPSHHAHVELSDVDEEHDAESHEYDADCKAGPSFASHHHPSSHPSAAMTSHKMTAALSAEHERVFNSLPLWLRPTVLSYLNFDMLEGVDTSACADKPSSSRTVARHDAPVKLTPEQRKQKLYYGRAVQILPEDFEHPSKLMQARVTMVLPIEKVIAAFGPPLSRLEGVDNIEDNNSDQAEGLEMCYADWFLALQPLAPSLTVDEKVDAFDESLQFAIKASGEDLDLVTSLASFCLFNALVVQPEVFVLQPSPERLVQCEIVHHASMTEHLLAYLETVLDGVRFLCHYELPFCVEDDDAELLYFARRVIKHPLCMDEQTESKSQDESVERIALRAESKHDTFGASVDSKDTHRFREGRGALLGVDLQVAGQSLAALDMSDAAELFGMPLDLAEAVRPIEQRLEFFSGHREDFDEAAWLFALIHRQQMLLSGSVDGDSDLDLDNDNDQDSYIGDGEGAEHGDAAPNDRIRNTAKLDAEYAGARLKIVDLGNACWTYKHFTDDIQTRQYRAPEVLVGAPYDTSADMWSVACIVFELLTGDLMFDPQAGKNWNREEDHLALMIELLGKFPKSLLPKGKFSYDYFNKKGELKHIHNLNYWGLEGVLVEKYKFTQIDAAEIAHFLLNLLEMDPERRATAQQCLQHPFLNHSYDGKGSRERYFDSKHDS
uniref:non-specific serine/threonine protein kinase n=1 Tax=Spumella elongata TaxID=89044 RepID=A0A7S3H2P1_9STRA|mmetsp:Transcript_3047/g.5066  ORF Transcript_3047/g.5066 Transcript_3047/m.5066 type:complete len:1162 (+) Transcript_3047:85-3570(+)